MTRQKKSQLEILVERLAPGQLAGGAQDNPEQFRFESREGFFIARTKKYNRHQDMAGGCFVAGAPVKHGITGTAGHRLDEQDINALCFVFGYKLLDPSDSSGSPVFGGGTHEATRTCGIACEPGSTREPAFASYTGRSLEAVQ